MSDILSRSIYPREGLQRKLHEFYQKGYADGYNRNYSLNKVEQECNYMPINSLIIIFIILILGYSIYIFTNYIMK